MTKSTLLDGNNFKSISDHIIALHQTGIYVQPRSSQGYTYIIFSEQRTLKANESFEGKCIEIIKEVLGERLIKEAKELAAGRSMSMEEYAKDLEEGIENFEYPGELHLIDKNNPLYGQVWKKKWSTDPLIDPVQLERCFGDVFRSEFSESEAEVFKKSFENYWSSDYPEEYDAEVEPRWVFHALDNYEFYSDLFDIKSKVGRSAYKKFETLIMDSIYSPFSEYCTFEFSSDNCYFFIDKNLFYVAIAGLRNNGMVDICIFDGING